MSSYRPLFILSKAKDLAASLTYHSLAPVPSKRPRSSSHNGVILSEAKDRARWAKMLRFAQDDMGWTFLIPNVNIMFSKTYSMYIESIQLSTLLFRAQGYVKVRSDPNKRRTACKG